MVLTVWEGAAENLIISLLKMRSDQWQRFQKRHVKAVVHVTTNSLRWHLRQLRQPLRKLLATNTIGRQQFSSLDATVSTLKCWRNEFVATSEKAFTRRRLSTRAQMGEGETNQWTRTAFVLSLISRRETRRHSYELHATTEVGLFPLFGDVTISHKTIKTETLDFFFT